MCGLLTAAYVLQETKAVLLFKPSNPACPLCWEIAFSCLFYPSWRRFLILYIFLSWFNRKPKNDFINRIYYKRGTKPSEMQYHWLVMPLYWKKWRDCWGLHYLFLLAGSPEISLLNESRMSCSWIVPAFIIVS